jgi:hypothetical protein
MEHPTPQMILSARVNDFTNCSRLLLDTGHTLPTLIILYSAIDIFGSLLRPETEPNTAGIYFKKWVDNYMLGHSQVQFTAEDLWGARCGLLHTHTASSELSRQGKARQLHYFRGSPPLGIEQAMKSLEPKGKIFVDVDVLNATFEQGTRRFLAEIQRDSQLEKRVLHHSSHLFGVILCEG